MGTKEASLFHSLTRMVLTSSLTRMVLASSLMRMVVTIGNWQSQIRK